MPTERLKAALESDHKLRLLQETKEHMEKADGLLNGLGMGQSSMELGYVLANVTNARSRRIAEIVDEAVRPD